jgi:putative exporter of polyketide antibiotics
VAAVALVAGGFALADRRDLGAGLIAARRGSPEGRGLGRPGRLAWRLHRATFAVWAVGMFIGGAVYGSIADDIERLIDDNPAFADLLAELPQVLPGLGSVLVKGSRFMRMEQVVQAIEALADAPAEEQAC